MGDAIIVQMPHGAPEQLILLFHGVGSTPESLAPIGRRLAGEFSLAAVISVQSPDSCDLGAGLQWFSVRGITEENRAQRIADTMPRFVDRIRGLQQATGTTPTQTALIGFSQGAIMALESTQTDEHLAGRVVSIAGRFAQAPKHAPALTTLHFIHGKSDPVIPYSHAVTAVERLVVKSQDVLA